MLAQEKRAGLQHAGQDLLDLVGRAPAHRAVLVRRLEGALGHGRLEHASGIRQPGQIGAALRVAHDGAQAGLGIKVGQVRARLAHLRVIGAQGCRQRIGLHGQRRREHDLQAQRIVDIGIGRQGRGLAR